MEALSFPAPAARGSLTLGSLGERMLRLPLSRRGAAAAGVLLTALVILGDYLTTAEAAFTIVYLIPIGLGTWFRSRAFGIATAFVCTAGTIATDLHGHTGLQFLLWDGGGEILMFMGFVGLLSAFKRQLETEQQLRRASIDQLRHAERLSTLGKLASGVAHELGTPLNVILGRAELIQEGRVNARESAHVIAQQAERMTSIIRQLLDFARKSGTDKGNVLLKQLCEETAALLQPLARKARVEISVSGENVEVALNRTEMQQVLGNLITNSVQAMPRGGKIEITISRQPVNVDPPEGPRRGMYALLSVRDQGTGIPVAILPKIFDPFFTTKDVGEGTGLGLSVSHGIVRDHGGWMRVKSDMGQGTTFFVYLPLET